MEKLGLAMAEVSHDGRDQVKLHYMGQVDMAARQLKESTQQRIQLIDIAFITHYTSHVIFLQHI